MRSTQNTPPLAASLTRALLLAVVVVSYLVPMVIIVLNSLKTEAEAKTFDLKLPAKAQWSNFGIVLSNRDVLRGLVNGLIIAAGITAVTIVVCAMAGYVIARRPGALPKISYNYLLLGLIVPYAFVPAITLLLKLGIFDTYLSIILVNASIQIPFTTLLMSGFVQGIPREIDEAAEMDGAGPVRTFFRIIFPMLKPVVATSMVLLFSAGWNEFITVLYLLPDKMKATVPMSFFQFQGDHTYQYNLVSANMIVSILPVLVLYLFAQRYIIEGMNTGSLKG